eukprot:scaffold38790_cov214-Amphora_coffeaeformis.AAC.2
MDFTIYRGSKPGACKMCLNQGRPGRLTGVKSALRDHVGSWTRSALLARGLCNSMARARPSPVP